MTATGKHLWEEIDGPNQYGPIVSGAWHGIQFEDLPEEIKEFLEKAAVNLLNKAVGLTIKGEVIPRTSYYVEAEPLKKVISSDDWQCSMCTWVNLAGSGNGMCGHCGRPRPTAINLGVAAGPTCGMPSFFGPCVLPKGHEGKHAVARGT